MADIWSSRSMLRNARFQIPGRWFRIAILCQWNMDSGFQSLVGSVLDSLSCIPDSKAQDSGFHELNFPRFRIPHAKILRISESVFPYTGRIKGGSRNFWAVQVLLRYTSWSCYGCRPRAIIWLLRVGPWCHDALSNDVMWHDATTGSPSSVLARV